MTTTTITSTSSSRTLSLMSELVSYPVLLQHEEALTREGGSLMYDVSSWMLYLSEIDSLLEVLQESIAASSSTTNTTTSGTTTTTSSKRNRSSSLLPVEVGGRSIARLTDGSKNGDVERAHRLLQKARNLISERSLSLLPGSYKLWRDYLQFRSNVYMKPRVSPSNHTAADAAPLNSKDDDEDGIDEDESPPSSLLTASASYVLTCSPEARRFHATKSAYERSLVRMNKYPRIWLSYLSFLIHASPSPNNNNIPNISDITTIRRTFDRALLALPATQHDLIWSDYLTYILNGTPPPPNLNTSPKTNNNSTKTNTTPLLHSLHTGKLPTQSPPFAIPHETTLRVLRRYARYYNPAGRELLASTAESFGRYGEAAGLYRELLDEGAEFWSVVGTTRCELWMRLADICIRHGGEVGGEGGVDFEGIVRAVLKPIGGSGSSGRGGGGGWEILEEVRVEDAGVDQKRKKKDKQKLLEEKRAQLQASLGEMEGTLWTKLAQYQIRNGEFELARSIYEEAMECVSRVRDFSLIFDGYIKFEEGVIEAMMEMMNDDDEEEEEEAKEGETKERNNNLKDSTNEEDEEDMDILLGHAKSSSSNTNDNDNNDDTDDETPSADVELALARAENLMSRRPLLLNRVLLRQNPHNVGEWLKRSTLYLKLTQPIQAVAALEEAIQAVDSNKAMNGSPATLYTTLALKLHEETSKDVDAARAVFGRICRPMPEYNFKKVDDLAQCYAAWVEMELRVEGWDKALEVARSAVAPLPKGDEGMGNSSSRIARGLVKSSRAWNLLLDLEESLGTIQTTKDAYNRALEVKVATPSHILNFANFLTESKYFEESFTAYERGVDLFPFPNPSAILLWKEYLQAFEKRYAGTKIHRMRELYDRCLSTCPPADASQFFLSYGTFEEHHGLTKRALSVYERMCTTLPTDEKYTSYQLYIAKTVRYIGILATRPVYERAIAALTDTPASNMCCEFAKMEASLHEIDRARVAFTYGAQLADPRVNPSYWGKWHEFEVSHGNEETFREMLRIKRGVQAAFSTVNYNAAEMGAGVPKEKNLTEGEALDMISAREGVDGRKKERIGGFVQGKRTAEIKDLDEVERRAAKLRKVTAGLVAATQEQQVVAGDEDEIDLEDEEESVDEGFAVVVPKVSAARVNDVSTKAVPAAVFGGLAPQIDAVSKS